MIKQNPITDYREVAKRIMNHIWRDWDIGSPAHRFWLRYCQTHMQSLKEMQWRNIYKFARASTDEKDMY